MKVNAPEKIYIEVTSDGTRYYRDVVKEERTENTDIEYIRTDAFIEKVCKLLARMIWKVTYEDLEGNSVQHFDKIEFIEDFKKHIKVNLEIEQRMKDCPYRQIGCTMYKDKILECTGACSWVVDYLNLKKLKAQKGEQI